jgi:hypothetical protein
VWPVSTVSARAAEHHVEADERRALAAYRGVVRTRYVLRRREGVTASRARGSLSLIGERSRSELASLHAWVHGLEPEWWTTSVNFQRGPLWVKIGSTRWRLQNSFYAARWGWTRNSHVRYSVSFSLSPAKLSGPERARLKRSGVLDGVAAVFKKLGYAGQWHEDAGGFGLFSKALRTQSALRREVAQLRNIPIGKLLGELGRTTRR